MADSLVTQSAAPATVPATTPVAARFTTYGGVAGQYIAPVGIVQFTGADGAKVSTDVNASAPLSTKQNGATPSVTSVGASAANVTVLAANASRLRAWLYNDDPAISVFIKFGANATAALFTKKMLPGEFFTVEFYTGIVDAIWESAPSGSMRITELTP